MTPRRLAFAAPWVLVIAGCRTPAPVEPSERRADAAVVARAPIDAAPDAAPVALDPTPIGTILESTIARVRMTPDALAASSRVRFDPPPPPATDR